MHTLVAYTPDAVINSKTAFQHSLQRRTIFLVDKLITEISEVIKLSKNILNILREICKECIFRKL